MQKSWNALLDASLRKICHYQQIVPQHYSLLDTLVMYIKVKKKKKKKCGGIIKYVNKAYTGLS